MFHTKNLCAFGSFLKILLLLNLVVTKAKGRACIGNTYYDLIQGVDAVTQLFTMKEIRLLSLTEWYYLVRHFIAIVQEQWARVYSCNPLEFSDPLRWDQVSNCKGSSNVKGLFIFGYPLYYYTAHPTLVQKRISAFSILCPQSCLTQVPGTWT